MALTVTHPFVSGLSDSGDTTRVRPSNWNATHTISGTLDVASGGTGQTTEAEALGEMTQALTAGIPDFYNDYLMYYDSSADTAKKVSLASFREKLTASRILYVRTDGDDTADGLTDAPGVPGGAGAFLTLQHAVKVCQELDKGIDPSNEGFGVHIELGAGTFAGCQIYGPEPHAISETEIGGAGVDVTFIDNTTTYYGIQAVDTRILVGDLTFTGSGGVHMEVNDCQLVGDTKFDLDAGQVAMSGSCICLNVDVTVVGSADAYLVSQTVPSPNNPEAHWNFGFGSTLNSSTPLISVQGNGQVTLGASGGQTLAGAAAVAFDVSNGGRINITRPVTLSGTPAYSTAFARATTGGRILVSGTGAFTHSATGVRYIATTNGLIDSNSGGETRFPGNAQGTTTSGGSYGA